MMWTFIQCVFLWTSGDARGLGLRLSVCACAVGLGGHRLTWTRGTWGVDGRSAHVLTILFTWLRSVNDWGWTAHASRLSPGSTRSLKLCEECVVFFFLWGHVNFDAQIWALWRHFGHVCSMLDSDWLKKILLRSDWLPLSIACLTTRDLVYLFHCMYLAAPSFLSSVLCIHVTRIKQNTSLLTSRGSSPVLLKCYYDQILEFVFDYIFRKCM